MFSLSDYAYQLPEELIAQQPSAERDGSRLLVLNRYTGEVEHRYFRELSEFLVPGDVLVINDTQVISGRLMGRKETGGRVEVLILDYEGGMARLPAAGAFISECLVSASKRVKPGTRIHFDKEWFAEVIEGTGPTFSLRFEGPRSIEALLSESGKIPLPPYIRRNGQRPVDDKKAYQTVYAAHKGAIAAPTAGLHFTDALLATLSSKGVRVAAVTLHVGYGTFVPVRVTDIRNHIMHMERYHVNEKAADAINNAKKNGRRIVAVGTTSVRTLEHAADQGGRVRSGTGDCNLFIYPGYQFRVVDAIITNFHLPETTLLMLVSAFAGRERVLAAYQRAIENRYRFYSYGDAMLITPLMGLERDRPSDV